jgi:hypothetical protein
VSPVRYELGSHISEDDILHTHRREYLKSYKEANCFIVPNVTSSFGLVRFEVFTAVTLKNGVFWDVTPFGCCKNRRFGGT